LIGLPGDTIQFINGDLHINNKKLKGSQFQLMKRLDVVIFY